MLNIVTQHVATQVENDILWISIGHLLNTWDIQGISSGLLRFLGQRPTYHDQKIHLDWKLQINVLKSNKIVP